jgi:hypothetical protein
MRKLEDELAAEKVTVGTLTVHFIGTPQSAGGAAVS